MARGRKPKNWSLFPNLHHEVDSLLSFSDLNFTFNDNDTASGSLKEYDTNVMGFFPCRNNKCSSNGWFSKKIPITIRLYRNDEYNARVYHQRCLECNWVVKPELDEAAYAERVSYRLKRWSGVWQEKPVYNRETGKGPHQKSLCEGCKNGRCTEGYDAADED